MSRSRRLTNAFVITTIGLGGAAASLAGCSGEVAYINPLGCPASVPASGGSCNDSALECRYDEICPSAYQWARCNGSSWEIDTPPPCNPPPCPESAPQVGEPCSEPNQSCHYGSDECGEPIIYSCGDSGNWSNEPSFCNPPPPGECPSALPINGAECSAEPGGDPPSGCSYKADTPCGPNQATANCELNDIAGVFTWTVTLASQCSVSPDACTSYSHETLCDADPGCRWLAAPLCGSGTLPEIASGCYAAGDCAQTGCGDWGSCETVEHDPCYQQYCDACSGETNVCLALSNGG